MGERSTKGYAFPVIRPLACLGKTLAHELGHALALDHPAGKAWSCDGASKTAQFGRDNLMTGGQDRSGGGGERFFS
jgi:hypothetical protein